MIFRKKQFDRFIPYTGKQAFVSELFPIFFCSKIICKADANHILIL